LGDSKKIRKGLNNGQEKKIKKRENGENKAKTKKKKIKQKKNACRGDRRECCEANRQGARRNFEGERG
jgi:hypothetical protein